MATVMDERPSRDGLGDERKILAAGAAGDDDQSCASEEARCKAGEYKEDHATNVETPQWSLKAP